MAILLLFLLLILAAVVLQALGWIPGRPRRPEQEREAEALRARLARGEIDSAEFNARLRELDAASGRRGR